MAKLLQVSCSKMCDAKSGDTIKIVKSKSVVNNTDYAIAYFNNELIGLVNGDIDNNLVIDEISSYSVVFVNNSNKKLIVENTNTNKVA